MPIDGLMMRIYRIYLYRSPNAERNHVEIANIAQIELLEQGRVPVLFAANAA
jgi:hypothetical protein